MSAISTFISSKCNNLYFIKYTQKNLKQLSTMYEISKQYARIIESFLKKTPHNQFQGDYWNDTYRYEA